MRGRENEPPLPDALAYFITWSTYGTWLPGDSRGWVEYHHGWKLPDPVRELEASAKMAENACRLDQQLREAVHEQVTQTCAFRNWPLYAVNCRSNHAHLVVTAPQHPKTVRLQIKAWCTRKLKSFEPLRDNWWAERGSVRWINDEDSLESAILYVRDGQDHSDRRFH
jgi:hypothetical protein